MGRMELPAMGLKIPLTEYAVVPQRMYMLMESPEIGRSEVGSNGTVFWELSQMTGPRLHGGDEVALAKRTAFTEELRWRDHYQKAETTGIDTVPSREAHPVVATVSTTVIVTGPVGPAVIEISFVPSPAVIVPFVTVHAYVTPSMAGTEALKCSPAGTFAGAVITETVFATMLPT
mgnify:CR=1 FL=1